MRQGDDASRPKISASDANAHLWAVAIALVSPRRTPPVDTPTPQLQVGDWQGGKCESETCEAKSSDPCGVTDHRQKRWFSKEENIPHYLVGMGSIRALLQNDLIPLLS